MKWLMNQFGREGFPPMKKFCFFALLAIFTPILFFAGYGTHVGVVLHNSSPCDRLEIIDDMNPFAFQHDEALLDKELACLIVNSNFPSSEYEWVFKTIYCESSKKPYEVKRFGKVNHHGLSMISDLNLKLLKISNYRILYNPERNLFYMHKLWRLRGRQPWETDSTKSECMNNGPNMDGKEKDGTMLRDGWEWADKTFELYFKSGPERVMRELIASI